MLIQQDIVPHTCMLQAYVCHGAIDYRSIDDEKVLNTYYSCAHSGLVSQPQQLHNTNTGAPVSSLNASRGSAGLQQPTTSFSGAACLWLMRSHSSGMADQRLSFDFCIFVLSVQSSSVVSSCVLEFRFLFLRLVYRFGSSLITLVLSSSTSTSNRLVFVIVIIGYCCYM